MRSAVRVRRGLGRRLAAPYASLRGMALFAFVRGMALFTFLRGMARYGSLQVAVLVVAAAAQAAPTGMASGHAHPNKSLRVAFQVAETGFDPQAISDLYSGQVMSAIFEPLLSFEYLARPYRLAPLVAESLPEISADGRHWRIRLKKGIWFADDPAFKGKKRELVADDFVFAWKRVLDPKVRSPYLWFLDGYVMGADAAVEEARRTGRFDYDRPIEGLRATDRHTIELRLTRPNYLLVEHMSAVPLGPMAREVVETYGDPSTGHVAANPVGTGAYRLAQWRRGQRIVLEANPNFREEYFPESTDPADRQLVASMKGKRLPQIGRIEIGIIEEGNPRLLSFNSKELDYVNVPFELAMRAVSPGGALVPFYAEQGVQVQRIVMPSLAYTYFNMDDPIVGGYEPAKIALRRAMVMGYNTDDDIRHLYHGQALPATQPIPPGLIGHEPRFKGRAAYDPELANALLDRFGYRDRDGDGYREMPDGSPLRIVKASTPSARDRELDELWKKSMDAIGIRLEFLKQKWPDLLKMGKAGQLQMWGVGWSGGSDGDSFLQLLYSRNIGQSNYSRFKLDTYDRLYEQARALPNGAERNDLYRRLSEIAAVYTPWDFGVYRIENTLAWPWLLGYKKHAFRQQTWKYFDIDLAKRDAAN